MDQLIALLNPVSPLLAAALTGPASSLALEILGKAVVQDSAAGVEEIAAALASGTPDAQLKIRDAEAQFLSSASGIELAKIAAAESATRQDTLVRLETQAANDRANARLIQSQTNDRTNSYLAYLITIGFFGAIGLVACKGDPTNAVLQTLLGVLGTGWVGVVSFYFGSSVGSKEKTALLGEAATPPKRLEV